MLLTKQLLLSIAHCNSPLGLVFGLLLLPHAGLPDTVTNLTKSFGLRYSTTYKDKGLKMRKQLLATPGILSRSGYPCRY
jgi:hypothetical protein